MSAGMDGGRFQWANPFSESSWIPEASRSCPADKDGGTTNEKRKTCQESSSVLNFLQQEDGLADTRSQSCENDDMAVDRHNCDTCNKAFRFLADQEDHRAEHTLSEAHTTRRKNMMGSRLMTPSLECEVCQKSYVSNRFGDSSTLKRHVGIHTGEKRSICSTCRRKFAADSAPTDYTRTHTAEKSCTCRVCGKKCSQSRNLTRHALTHTGEKRYNCSVCGERFTRAENLSQHARIHTGEKPYTCPFCCKTFRTSPTLNMHTRIHTGETPYACTVCGRGFRHSGNLNRHTRIHKADKLR